MLAQLIATLIHYLFTVPLSGLTDCLHVTERVLLRLGADATEYGVIGLANGATALKLGADAVQ